MSAVKLQISVNKDDVLLEVGRLTSYLGKKKTSDDKPTYDRIAAIEADDDMLLQYWNESTDALSVLLKEFYASFSEEKTDTDGTTYVGFYSDVIMSEFWDKGLAKKVNKLVFEFIKNYIVARWLMITMAYDDAEKYDKIADDAMSELTELLYTTKRPSYGITVPQDDVYEVKERDGIDRYNTSAKRWCFVPYLNNEVTFGYLCTYLIGTDDKGYDTVKRDRLYAGYTNYAYVTNVGEGTHNYTGVGAIIFESESDAQSWVKGDDTISQLASLELLCKFF